MRRTIIIGVAMAIAVLTGFAAPDGFRERVEKNIRILGAIESCAEGYDETVGGSTLSYASFRPDPSPALITRATTGTMAITWKTLPAPQAIPGGELRFVVMAGLYGQEPSGFSFHLSVNHVRRFSFVSSPAEHWEVQGNDGGRLRFISASKDKYGDLFGCLMVVLPSAWINAGEPVEFSLVGEAANNSAWCMVFQAPDVVTYQKGLVENEAYCDLRIRVSRGIAQLFIEGPSAWEGRDVVATSGSGAAAKGRAASGNVSSHAELLLPMDQLSSPLTLAVGTDIVIRLDSLFTPIAHSSVQPRKLLTIAAPPPDTSGWKVRYESRYHPSLAASFLQLAGLTGGRGTQHLMISTHQDIAWMDSPAQCIEDRDVKIISPLLAIMRSDPNYHFDLEDVLILREFLGRHPDRKAEIHALLREGRLGVGASFNQPYEDLCSGEMLVRQFIAGRRWLQKEFPGCDTRTYWNPDVPGRTLQMAQVMRRAGVSYLSMSRFSKGLYTWRSPDGSSILAFSPGHYADFKARVEGTGFEQAAGYVALSSSEWLKATNFVSYDLPLISMSDMSGPDRYDMFLAHWESLHTIMQPDGSPTPLSLPPIRPSTIQRFFDQIAPACRSLPAISGERPNLWLYIHGPTHHDAVSSKREADILLPAAEIFSAIGALLDGSFSSYPHAALTEAWESQLYPDHGWGGKNGEVTDSTFRAKYESARSTGHAILTGSLRSIASHINTRPGAGTRLVVFNSLSWIRSGPVRVTVNAKPGEFPAGVTLNDASGRSVPVQLDVTLRHPDGSIASADLLFVAQDIPSVGYSTFTVQPSIAVARHHAGLEIPRTLESPFYRIELGEGGAKQIFDKELGMALLDTTKFRGGEMFSMQSIGEDAGEWSEPQQPTMDDFERLAATPTVWTRLESGPVRDVVVSRHALRHATVEQRLILYKNIKRIDFEVSLFGWDGTPYREFRLAFPLHVDEGKVIYEVPFGTLEVGKDEMKGAPGERYTLEAFRIHPRAIQNWIGLYGRRIGITISSSVAVWDYLDPTDQESGRILLQPVLLASRRSCHGEGPWYLQKGDHHFRFSLTSHTTGRSVAFRSGVQANTPLFPVVAPPARPEADLPVSRSFVSIDAHNVVLSTMKRSEGDETLIARVYDLEGNRAPARLTFFRSILNAQEVNLIEEPGVPVQKKNRALVFTVDPFAIHTVRFTPGRR